jgi:hypothetical protein
VRFTEPRTAVILPDMTIIETGYDKNHVEVHIYCGNDDVYQKLNFGPELD